MHRTMINNNTELLEDLDPVDAMIQAAEAVEGLRYDSPEAVEIMNPVDWSQHWPIVDRLGILTGDICGDSSGYLCVHDMAMVPISEARGLPRPIDGYVDLQLPPLKDPAEQEN